MTVAPETLIAELLQELERGTSIENDKMRAVMWLLVESAASTTTTSATLKNAKLPPVLQFLTHLIDSQNRLFCIADSFGKKHDCISLFVSLYLLRLKWIGAESLETRDLTSSRYFNRPSPPFPLIAVNLL